jgi:hypothetical protein
MVFRLFVGQQLQEPLASGFVVVCLSAEQPSENGDILLMNELFHECLFGCLATRRGKSGQRIQSEKPPIAQCR